MFQFREDLGFRVGASTRIDVNNSVVGPTFWSSW